MRQSSWLATVILALLLAPMRCPADDLQGLIDAALAQGGQTITVPPGRYRVAPRDGQCLRLHDLRDRRIVCDGVELVCTETTRALSIDHCVGLTVRGLTIDYDPLPFTQGRLTAVSADKSVHQVELSRGYPPAAAATTFKYEIFRPDTRTHRCGEYPIQTLERLDPTHLRITRRGSRPTDPEQVGDVVAIGAESAPGGSLPHAVALDGCRGVRLEDFTLYASPCYGFLEDNCDGTIYARCRIDRRSPESDLVQRAEPRVRSLNADAFHSRYAGRGPSYLACAARFMADDCINICGDYHLIASSAGRALRVISKQREAIDIAAGDTVELLAYNGLRLPDARVVRLEPAAPVTEAERQFIAQQAMEAEVKEALGHARAFGVTLDRDVDLPAGSVIASATHNGNGFVVRGCDFGFNRSRGIVAKASHGVIQGNTLTANAMAAILVAPEWWWLESGSGHDVSILGNTIRDCGDTAIAVYAFGGTAAIAPAGAHRNIQIRGNHMTGCPLPNVLVTSTDGLDLSANTFVGFEGKPASEWTRWAFGLQDRTLAPVMRLGCTDVRGLGRP